MSGLRDTQSIGLAENDTGLTWLAGGLGIPSSGLGGDYTVTLTESLTLSTVGATTTSVNAVPAGAILLAVPTKVTTGIVGAATYKVTVGATQVSTSATVSGAINTTDPGTLNLPLPFASTTHAVITCAATPSAGVVQVQFKYVPKG